MTPTPATRTIGLVAARELRTRLRSRAFQAATVIMLLAVVAAIVLPAVLRSDTPTTRHIGLAGTVPVGLPEALTAQAAAFGMLVLLFAAISIYGGQVLTGVVEEKSTRVVELLLARMPPWQLLAGKVLGIGLLALGQLLLVGVAASASAAVVGAVDVPRVGAGLVAWLLVWFLVGFGLWSVVYGALGALASRSEDAQTVSAPATTVLLTSYFFAMFAALSDPDALTTRIASFVPVTAPLVMPIRLARGHIAPWETLLALGLAVAAIYLVVRLAGRVYAGALLRTGAKVRLRDAWRLGTTGVLRP